MRYFLGVDVGGTKTHALIADEKGIALGFGLDGAGNWQSVGFDGLRKVVGATIDQALSSAQVPLDQISAAGFGIAGYDWPSQLAAHLEAVTSIGLNCPLELTNDAIIGLLAGAAQGWGIVLVAGTGNNCRGRDRDHREARITGEGIRFGEFGGASEMVMKAVQAVAYEWSRRGPKTCLSGMFIKLAGAKDLNDLVEGIDLERYRPDPAWAPLVFEAASLGDPVARDVITWSANELGESGCAVIRQLGIEGEEFEIVMAGSIFDGGELYIEPLRHTIQKLAPRAKLVRLEAPPVVGGVILAMQKAGLPTTSVHRALIESTRRFIRQA
ncbi:MAG TPA: BadF/BadG/BcrA/BcrD ATPase family protein [Anaerolineales bacterium]|nr:BadF/BadG/BcrA/BcrD ATPase family protein [Anaerolineales bacterium]